MSGEREELAAVVYQSRWVDGIANAEMVTDGKLADAILAAGYRKIFDGDCGLSNAAPDERDAAEAWMRWANILNTSPDEERNGIEAMRQMLTEFGYRKPRTVTTVEELDALPNESLILDARSRCREGLTSVAGRNWWRSMGPAQVLLSKDIPLPATLLHEGDANV